jgi:hypothetical protein
MSTPDIDPFEARARQAALSAHRSVRGIDMTGLAAPSRSASLRTPSRALLFAAACVVLLLVAGTVLTRNVLSHDEGVPAFQPQPLPGSQPFTSQLEPSVSYRIPARHLASPDDPGLTVVKFDGIPAGGLVAMRVRSYATGDRQNLVAAVAADNRLRVLHQVQTTVGGEPATRLVVTPVPGTTASEWFCPDSDNPCFDLDPTGRTTLYLFDHQGARYLLSGGGISDSSAAKLQPIVDGAAATWHW